MNKTSVSGNNKFLSELGLIKGRKKKSPTPLGIKLGRALEHSQQSEISESWQKAIGGNEKFFNLAKTVGIKGGMSEEKLLSHILYVSGQKSTPGNRTGARTIADILIKSGLLEQQDGQLDVPTPRSEIQEEFAETATSPPKDKIVAKPPAESDMAGKQTPTVATCPAIAINIQLQLPETENPEIYENLFKALRKHLLTPDE